ncbi:MAG: patatin-like phospholipase family protein [Chitinophagaceae bacterium]|nr:patatin-like phospholipase family protein [Chitinophagaceae bacterium]
MKYVLFLVCCIAFAFECTAQSNFKNLVFEGGGVRGIAYAGVIQALEDEQALQGIERTAGTSSGSVAALMVALGYTASEIDSIMFAVSYESFNDGGGFFIGGIRRLKKSYGWYRGNEIETWIGKLIESKTGNPNITFEQLHALRLTDKRLKDVFVTGTNITTQKAEIFSYVHTPSFPVKTAVRISCSIPLYFEPVYIDSSGTVVKKRLPGVNYNVYADGGVLANFPISIFDSCVNGTNPLMCEELIYNNQTLGLKLDRPEQIEQQKKSGEPAPYNTTTFTNYLNAFVGLMIEAANRRNFHAEKGRTIYISTANLSAKVRKVSKEEKQLLFNNGCTATLDFFNSLKETGAQR